VPTGRWGNRATPRKILDMIASTIGEDIHMASAHLNAFSRVPINARAAFMMRIVLALLLLAGIFFSRLPAAAQERAPRDATVKQVANDVYFDSRMTIRLGGREIRLFYLGPGQQAGDTFVHFPHARLLFAPGAFAKHSMPNMAFTPSVDNWIALLDRIAEMDVDTILPAHGDIARREDVKELAAMLADEYATVKDSVSHGVGLDQAVKTLTFPQYKDWRNYGRLQGEIRALYELIQTGKRSYFD
jgi:hypothetical protein